MSILSNPDALVQNKSSVLSRRHRLFLVRSRLDAATSQIMRICTFFSEPIILGKSVAANMCESENADLLFGIIAEEIHERIDVVFSDKTPNVHRIYHLFEVFFIGLVNGLAVRPAKEMFLSSHRADEDSGNDSDDDCNSRHHSLLLDHTLSPKTLLILLLDQFLYTSDVQKCVSEFSMVVRTAIQVDRRYKECIKGNCWRTSSRDSVCCDGNEGEDDEPDCDCESRINAITRYLQQLVMKLFDLLCRDPFFVNKSRTYIESALVGLCRHPFVTDSPLRSAYCQQMHLEMRTRARLMIQQLATEQQAATPQQQGFKRHRMTTKEESESLSSNPVQQKTTAEMYNKLEL